MSRMHDLMDETEQYYQEIKKWGLEKAQEYNCASVIPFLLLEGKIGKFINEVNLK